MERLRLEDLARLVDERPNRREQAAIDADPALRRELEALRSQKRALEGLPDILPPQGGWHRLEQKLASSGLIGGPLPGAGLWTRWLQAAAVIAVFIGGTAFGWVTASGSGAGIGSPDLAEAAAEESGGEAARVGAGGPAGSAASPSAASLEQARQAVEEAEVAWRTAYRRHQEIFHALNGQQPRRDPVARLAGIEALMAAGEAAVQESPDDEFLNFLYVNTLMERQQTIQQISMGAWH